MRCKQFIIVSLAGVVLAASLASCGGAVPADGRMAYCSESCARIALRRQKRDYMRKKRR